MTTRAPTHKEAFRVPATAEKSFSASGPYINKVAPPLPVSSPSNYPLRAARLHWPNCLPGFRDRIPPPPTLRWHRAGGKQVMPAPQAPLLWSLRLVHSPAERIGRRRSSYRHLSTGGRCLLE